MRDIYKKNLISLLLFMLIPISGLFGQGQESIKFFEVNQKAKINQSSSVTNKHYISLNDKIFRYGKLQVGDILEYQFNSVPRKFRIEKKVSFTENTFSVIAKSRNGSTGHLSFSIYRNRIMGSVHFLTKSKSVALKYDPIRNSNYIAVLGRKKAGNFICGSKTLESKKFDQGKINTSQVRSGYSNSSTDRATIDLMIVYTSKAKQWMENNGSVDLLLEDAMRRNQESLDNSDIMIDLKLTKTYQTDFNENISSSSTEILKMLTASPPFNPWYPDYDGFMEEVHKLRYTEKIDLVTLLIDNSNTDIGGYAWIGPSSRYAFSLSNVKYLSYYILTHEIGHNFGNSHSRNQKTSAADESGGRKKYSTGWRWSGTDSTDYVSIMTYEEGIDGKYDERVPHFSNPDVNYAEAPTGSYSGQYAPADNARSMNEVRFLAADHDQNMPTLGFNKNEYILKASETKKTVEFNAYTDWEIIYPNDGFAFIANSSQDKIYSGKGNKELTILAEKNTTDFDRYQTVTFKDRNGDYEVTLNIKQERNTQSPKVGVDKSKINFGKVNLGKSQKHVTTISNDGNTDLEGNVSLTGDSDKFFTLTNGGEYSIASAKSKEITVSFAPEVGGEKTGILTLTHNADNESSPIEIPLLGIGVEQPEIAVKPETVDLGVSGGKTSFEITNSGTGSLKWIASVKANWLTITNESKGTDAGTVRVSYEDNKKINARSDTLTIESDNAINSPFEIIINQSGRESSDAITVEYEAGWNLVSIPLEDEDVDLADYFDSIVTERIYEYDGKYKQPTTYTIGKGYWLKLNSGETIRYEGSLKASITIELNKGWNLIGTVADTLNTPQDLSDPESIIEESNVWKATYNNSLGKYELIETDIMIPGNGYFIKATENGDIELAK